MIYITVYKVLQSSLQSFTEQFTKFYRAVYEVLQSSLQSFTEQFTKLQDQWHQPYFGRVCIEHCTVYKEWFKCIHAYVEYPFAARALLASFLGHSQILSRSCEEKSPIYIGKLDCLYRPHIVWACCHHYVLTDPPFLVCDVVMVSGLLLSFVHSCKIKSGSGLGTRLGLSHDPLG